MKRKSTMRRSPLLMVLTLCLLAGCQSTPPDEMFKPACTPRRIDAGFCELPSNFNLFGTIVSGQLQPGYVPGQ
jgi:hypothetical protein